MDNQQTMWLQRDTNKKICGPLSSVYAFLKYIKNSPKLQKKFNLHSFLIIGP
jgi:hypothetical protein